MKTFFQVLLVLGLVVQAAMAAGTTEAKPTEAKKTSAPADFSESENPASIFGKGGNTITALQARGVVFLACHNAIWEIAARLIDSGRNPDQKSHEALAAELTNHLVEGVVLTPGITATILELQQAGFHYAA